MQEGAAPGPARDMLEGQEHFDAAKRNLSEGKYLEALEEIKAGLKLQPDRPALFLLKGQALIGAFESQCRKGNFAGTKQGAPNELFIPLKEAIESFKQYLKLNPQSADADRLQKQINLLAPYAEVAEKGNPARTIFVRSEIPTTKARILSKAEPEYPESARRARISGTVKLLVVLAADGAIKNVYVIQPLSHGLTDSAVGALRKIKFVPATKDGHPVSQITEIEYSFNLY